MSLRYIDTPCVGICSTVYGDDVCKGCKRTYSEVIAWNGLDDASKSAIYQRLDKTICDIFDQYLMIADENLLTTAIQSMTFRIPRHASLKAQAFYCLRADPYTQKKLADLGLQAASAHTEKSILRLFTEMDADILTEAEAMQQQVSL